MLNYYYTSSSHKTSIRLRGRHASHVHRSRLSYRAVPNCMFVLWINHTSTLAQNPPKRSDKHHTLPIMYPLLVKNGAWGMKAKHQNESLLDNSKTRDGDLAQLGQLYIK
jgi:hypothetical protein